MALGGVHHEPPEVAWLEPELEIGLELELKPLEPDELDELDAEPELEPEADDPVLDDPVLELPEDDAEVLCVDPGRARATAPVTTTLAMVTAVVAERTLARPFSLAATARRMASARALFMALILRSGFRRSLDEGSGLPMRP
jgi:hypothetical protein